MPILKSNGASLCYSGHFNLSPVVSGISLCYSGHFNLPPIVSRLEGFTAVYNDVCVCVCMYVCVCVCMYMYVCIPCQCLLLLELYQLHSWLVSRQSLSGLSDC